MNVFVIHRFEDRGKAKHCLKRLAKEQGLELRPVMLTNSKRRSWRRRAISAMKSCAAVVVFDPMRCDESPNAKWEMANAELLEIPVVHIPSADETGNAGKQLTNIFHFKDEFDACFPDSKSIDVLPLYKEMVASSESLIQRRQRTNAFFISAIGALLAVAGFVVGKGSASASTAWVLHAFGIAGVLLCRSWHNLIDNYGKLNRAKFDVILRLEHQLPAQAFAAEWISLGKGERRSKYRSFTSTEKSVPWLFGGLILVLEFALIAWQVWG